MPLTKEQYARAFVRRKFSAKYGTDGNVYRFCSDQGEFKTYMHFIKHFDGRATVYIWDTRKVVKQCKVSDLPTDYLPIDSDNYKELVFTDI